MRGRECAPFAPFSLIVYQKYKSSQKCTKCTRFRIRGRESAPFHLFRFSIRQTENKIRLEFNERRKICRPDLQREWVKSVTVLCFIAAAFLVCVGSLAYISLIHGNEYKLKAEQNQLSDTTVSAQRGTIYDSNMKALAKSASAWLVYINPSKITSDEQRDLVVTNLSTMLGVDEETVRKKAERTSSGYEKIAGEVETDVKDRLKTFISENKLSSIIGVDPDTKRYYPYSSFASTIIGFTDSDDSGRLGLELNATTAYRHRRQNNNG